MAIDTKILERIRALLAMAQDTSSPNEAAIAAGRAASLMRKYNLESADVIASELKHDENIIKQNARGNIWRAKARSIPKWSQQVAVNVAQLFDCAAIQAGGPGDWYVQFWGYHTDVEVAVWTFTYLLEQVKRNHERYCNAHDVSSTRSDRMAYIDGFALALNAKLQELKAQKQAAEQTESTSRALVVSKQGAIQAKFGAVGYREAKNRKAKGEDGFYHGYVDGSKVNITGTAPIGHDAGPQAQQLENGGNHG